MSNKIPRHNSPELNREVQERFRSNLKKKGWVRFELKATPENKVKIKKYAAKLAASNKKES